MAKLSPQFSGALRSFAFWVANGTVGYPLLEGIDYRSLLSEEPSALEMTFAIFANVIELDEAGNVLNAKWAEHRAAQYLKSYVTGEQPEQPFEEWEQMLEDPPSLNDALPWPDSRG